MVAISPACGHALCADPGASSARMRGSPCFEQVQRSPRDRGMIVRDRRMFGARFRCRCETRFVWSVPTRRSNACSSVISRAAEARARRAPRCDSSRGQRESVTHITSAQREARAHTNSHRARASRKSYPQSVFARMRAIRESPITLARWLSAAVVRSACSAQARDAQPPPSPSSCSCACHRPHA